MIDLLLFVLRAKRRIFVSTLAFGLLGVVIAFVVKPYFTATAVIMPPQQEQGTMSAIAGQLSSLGGLGAASAVGLKNPADMYVGILKSDGIAENLIRRFNLQAVYRTRLDIDTENRLAKESDFEAAKDGLIYIKVSDHDPARAAQLANAYVDELYALNSRLAVGQAAQRRTFFQKQLDDERKQLADAEDALKETQEKTGLIQLNGQAEEIIRNIASVKAQIASREVELGVARTYATDQNPDIAELEEQIAGLKKQLATLESTQGTTLPGDVQVPSGKVPEAGLDYLRKLREVRYHESLLELLAKQFEAASLDESKSAPQIQVVAPARTPERKAGPSRALIVLGLMFVGFTLATCLAIVTGVLRIIDSNPSQASRLQELKKASGLRTREHPPSA
ncbi:GumC family protein [Bryocella elongata]|uniref:GumC family protein n=1 Tax=Bryocella elongata TaxID=863522 RepID=UPI0013576A8F|nr:Wzz/FepE/Etk N-terminal domain-containing protein [Bryocella elongata]